LLARLMLGERRGHLAWIEGAVGAVTLYIDEHHAISTALAVLSLTQPDPPVACSAALPMGREDGGCHPRYCCEDHMEYIARYSLHRRPKVQMTSGPVLCRGAPPVRRLQAEVLQDVLVCLFVRHQYLPAVGHGSRFTL
jgi:hypothetical protein